MRFQVFARAKLFCTLALTLAATLTCNTGLAAWPEAQTDDQRAARLVQQALEAELEGDSNERNDLLEQAIRISPDYAPARWQLGQVHYATKWRSLYEIERIFSEDKRLAEYRLLRKRVKPDAQSHITLANWCEKNALEDQGRAHLLEALRYKPGDKRIIQRLGLVAHHGRLISKIELARQKEREKQARSKSQYWQRRISHLTRALKEGNQAQQFEALKQLRKITDPAAIPALETVFLKLTPATSFEERELRWDLIQVIGKMPQHEATLALLRQAVYSRSPTIRAAATGQLKNRPLHEYVPLLIFGMSSLVTTKVEIATDFHGTTYRHTFFRKGTDADKQVVLLRRYIPFQGRDRNFDQYDQRIVQSLTSRKSGDIGSEARRKSQEIYLQKKAKAREIPTIVKIVDETTKARQLALSEAASIERAVEIENSKAYQTNQPLRRVLVETTGADYGIDPGDWWRGWKVYNELYGNATIPVYTDYFVNPVHYYPVSSYEFNRSPTPKRYVTSDGRVITVFDNGSYSVFSKMGRNLRTDVTLPNGKNFSRRYTIPLPPEPKYARMKSCFIAGTKVWTRIGPVAIENILPGDRILAQDPDTGELAYKTVQETTVRPPDELVKIGLGKSSIQVTRGHPFWVTGQGWKMAKRLKVGDRLHSVNGSAMIDIVSTEVREKTFNLVVEDFHTYFVGERRILVHDNNYRQPTPALVPGLARKAIW